MRVATLALKAGNMEMLGRLLNMSHAPMSLEPRQQDWLCAASTSASGSFNVEAEICEVGARINSLKVNGVDIAFGFNSVEDYLKSGCYAGATIGRVAYNKRCKRIL